jgi:hypothetical protein
VAARHLWHYGYKPTVYYPKRSKNDLYQVSKLSVFLLLRDFRIPSCDSGLSPSNLELYSRISMFFQVEHETDGKGVYSG